LEVLTIYLIIAVSFSLATLFMLVPKIIADIESQNKELKVPRLIFGTTWLLVVTILFPIILLSLLVTYDGFIRGFSSGYRK